MGGVALKIPLRALAAVRSGQGRHPADTGIQTLGNALDGASFAGRIAPFEENDDLLSSGDDPFLKLDELALQAEELPKVEAAKSLLIRQLLGSGISVANGFIFDLEFQFLVEAVHEFVVDAVEELFLDGTDAFLLGSFRHGHEPAGSREERQFPNFDEIVAFRH